ncbi:plasma membrane iron permease-like protein [Amniculicola lignicola CBS 123094]|uniref:Plasma membrane iron permease-like protein n=1 Tax=Amniculicola lignicola CBS 123094 TaxID=1392246 RepID=A0A6A5W4Y9_9PLEO|nr:plasma membrane iron permease-like protein [Amniculicola lignicola CBS 123094]
MSNVFAVPVFFICFRECLETSIIVSVLLAFLKQTLGPESDAVVRKKLIRQVWVGVALGVLISLIICAGVIGTFYTAGRNSFESAEYIWEGVLAIVASVIITLMGAALLRVNKMQDKWRVKIAKVMEARDTSSLPFSGRLKRWTEKYAMFFLPFITVLREGIEAVLFIAGVGVGLPATAFPLAVICGIGAGALVGFALYKGANRATLQIFLIASTCFLYLIAAGLLSKGVRNLELDAWVKIAGEGAVEAGSGPGSYDIRKTVWHVTIADDAGSSGGWSVFRSIFGWQHSATYGSVISYNVYWLAVIVGFLVMGYREKTGRYPLQKAKPVTGDYQSESSNGHGTQTTDEKHQGSASGVREVPA